MNEEMAEKNRLYQDQITQIAKQLYYSFFFDEEERASQMPAVEMYEREQIHALLDKAERIYPFFESADEAKKAIRFLHAVNPVVAKEIFVNL